MLELAVVAAIIAILAALAIPSMSALTRGTSEGAMLTSLRSLFASARARAAMTQRYAAIRFQQDKNGRSYAVMLDQVAPSVDFPNGCPDYDRDCTYLTFVVAAGTQPIELPAGVELAHGDVESQAAGADAEWLPRPNDSNPNNRDPVSPATTFCVVFSPSGQIVRRRVHVAQRPDGWDAAGGIATWDTVFNLTADKPRGAGLFLPDVLDDANPPAVVPEGPGWNPPADRTDGRPPNSGAVNGDTAVIRMSQTSVLIHERQRRVDAGDFPYTGYVQRSALRVPLNVYTGAPVNVNR